MLAGRLEGFEPLGVVEEPIFKKQVSNIVLDLQFISDYPIFSLTLARMCSESYCS